MLDLEHCAATPDHWPLLVDLVRSEQVPEDRLVFILETYPGFAAYLGWSNDIPEIQQILNREVV